MTQEPMNAHDLARLTLEAQPHLDLLERIGGQLDIVLRLSAVLRQDWADMDDALRAAALAPDSVKASFHRATFEHYAKRYGLTPELLGALAHERRKADPAPARPGSLAPVTAEEVDRAFPTPVKESTPAVSELPRPAAKQKSHTSAQRAAHLDNLEALHTLLSQTPAKGAVIQARCAELGVKIGLPQISGLRGGSLLRYARAGSSAAGIGAELTQDFRAALELLLDPARTEEPRLPRTPAPMTSEAIQEALCPPIETPTLIPAERARQAARQDDVNPALLTTRKERERFIRAEAAKSGGTVKASEIKHALCLGYGPAVQIIKDIPGARQIGPDLYRLPA